MFEQNLLLARFTSEPCLVEPTMRDAFVASLNSAVAHPRFGELDFKASSDDDFWTELGDWGEDLRPYVVCDGVLHIPVKGVLLHDFPYTFYGWATGYAYIQRAFERGIADANVRAIAFIVHSPGGMVAGCFDAVDKMVAAKDGAGKPVQAFAHEMAYSAAYAIAGGVADTIAVSRTGGVGSVGVVTMHIDFSQMMDKAGVKVNFIHAGKHKVDGNAYEPLPDDVRARIQARIDEMYDVFVSAVARGRGLDEQAVRKTEALCFTATQALSNGFADTVGSLDDAIAAFAASLDDPSDNNGDEAMTDQVTTSAVDQAAHETAVAGARNEGKAEGLTEGAAAERTLVFAILDSDEGKKRPAAARALAAEGGRTLEQATAFLAKLPEEATNGGTGEGNPFGTAMGGGDNPDVGGGGEGGDDTADADSVVNDVCGLAAQIGLKGFAPQAKQ